MGMTLGEKIIARAAGVDFVKPNDIHTVTLVYVYIPRLKLMNDVRAVP